jgi:predicted Zn-dependent peptidase
MYWEFLDSGLAESAGIGSYENDDCGAVMSYLCCAPEQAQANLARLLKLQRDALDNGVTQKELDLAKRKIASHIVLGSERTESRMFSVGSQWLTKRAFKTVAEIAAEYEAVTLEQVNEAIRQFPLDKNMTVVVGPCENLVAAG